jgi:hypothetical protein
MIRKKPLPVPTKELFGLWRDRSYGKPIMQEVVLEDGEE